MLTLWLLACSADPLPARADRHAGEDPAPPTAPTPRDEPVTSPYTASEPTGASGVDCPAGLVCVDTLPFVHAGDTRSGTSDFSRYACAPDLDEGGREVVYRVTVAEAGFLAVTLSGLEGGADVDVHVLASLDPDDCIDRGHWEGATRVEPGTYWVTADSWVPADGDALEGAYTLSFQLTTADGIAVERALWAFDLAWKTGEATRLRLGVADFDRPSDERRFQLLDLATGDALFEAYVAHGEGSSDPDDAAVVAQMSNVEGSHMSSVGVFRAAETYDGTHGFSMRFDGLEPGFNDAVRDRAIVLHSAEYATEAYVAEHGRLGQSWGCTVFDPAISAEVIDALTDGGIFLSHFSDPVWLAESDFL